MRVATINDLNGQPVGKIIENEDGAVTGEGKGETLVEQAPLKSFDDWVKTVHHSSYLRLIVEA